LEFDLFCLLPFYIVAKGFFEKLFFLAKNGVKKPRGAER
jgi:hypothetical protein